jgi:hypothetical protein
LAATIHLSKKRKQNFWRLSFAKNNGRDPQTCNQRSGSTLGDIRLSGPGTLGEQFILEERSPKDMGEIRV